MLTVQETIDPKVFTYQITNEFGEAQPFTVLNLFRHIGYPRHVIKSTMSDGKEAIINLSKRYQQIIILRYAEQRMKAMYGNYQNLLPTAYSEPVEKVLKAYRKYNKKAEFYRTPETEDMIKADSAMLVPVMNAELTKYFITANNNIMNDRKWQHDGVRGMFVEILVQRIMVRMMIEDTKALKMATDPELTAIDAMQAKALTALCGGSSRAVGDVLSDTYSNNLKELSLTEVHILFNKLQYHLEDIAKADKAAQEAREQEKAQQAAPKALNARAEERAKDPNRRGKAVKEKKSKPKAQTIDEGLAALQEKFNRQHV